MSFLTLPAHSQRIERGIERDMAPATENSTAVEHSTTNEQSSSTEDQNATVNRNGTVHDWTHEHLLYPRFGPMDRLLAIQNDPRAIQSWEEGYRKEFRRWRQPRSLHHRGSFHRDWAISLAPAAATTQISVDNSMYPSKWTFDSNETVTAASCTADYIVFPVDAGPGGTVAGTQPNIVGLDNLYSGTTPAIGICNRGTPPTGDDGVSATVLFSYAVVFDDGVVSTSPTTSMDGKLIAFVEQGSVAVQSRFHVLAWRAGDGVNVTGAQDALTASIAPTTTTNAPAAGSGTVTDLPLGVALTTASTDSLSSPFVDYTNDVAYVGNDGGFLFKIKNVFCTTTACSTAVPRPAPSLDTSWGTGGIVTVCTGALTGPVSEGANGNVFVGCADGKLYGFTSTTGAAIPGNGLVVGQGVTVAINGGIFDPPVLDPVNGWVYVTSGSRAPGNMVVVQASVTNLATNNVATLQPAGSTNSGFTMHAPAFNDAYFSGVGTPLLYDYSSDSNPGAETRFWGITFTNVPNPKTMTSGIPTNSLVTGLPGSFEVSPVSEFLTTGVGGEDRLFASAVGSPGPGNIVSWNVTPGFPAGIESNATEGLGTSGIVIDDTSTASQANSLYFGVLGTPPTTNQNSAVKLTQVGFN